MQAAPAKKQTAGPVTFNVTVLNRDLGNPTSATITVQINAQNQVTGDFILGKTDYLLTNGAASEDLGFLVISSPGSASDGSKVDLSFMEPPTGLAGSVEIGGPKGVAFYSIVPQAS